MTELYERRSEVEICRGVIYFEFMVGVIVRGEKLNVSREKDRIGFRLGLLRFV